MSALGQKATSTCCRTTSAFPPTTDFNGQERKVRFGSNCGHSGAYKLRILVSRGKGFQCAPQGELKHGAAGCIRLCPKAPSAPSRGGLPLQAARRYAHTRV